MKKISQILITILLAVVSAFFVAACDNGSVNPPDSTDKGTSEIPDNSDEGTPDVSDGGNVLVVYFSWSSSGNTEKMANYIAEQIDATVWEITPVTPYPAEYTPTTEVAREEKENNARPAINNPLTQAQVDGYDAVFVGFPIWWHTAPMIIGTFLESYEWGSDVNIYPFFQGASNSNSSYYTETMEFIRTCAEGAAVKDGLYASQTNTTAIDNYLRTNGFIK